MYRTILILLCCLIFANAKSESYFVIHVKGTIKKATNKVLLKSGDEISSEEKLIFSSVDDRAAAISPSKGRFLIMLDDKAKKTEDGEFISIVKRLVLPTSGRMSTRNGKIKTLIEAQLFFEGKHLIIGNREAISLSDSEFLLDKNHFFYFSHIYYGEQVNKKLDYRADSLIFSKDDLLSLDGKLLNQLELVEPELFYYNSLDETSVKIADFIPFFVEKNHIAHEVDVIIRHSKPNQATKNVSSYLEEFYGKIYMPNLEKWLASDFK